MLTIAGGILIAFATILAAPLVVCWFIWLITGRGAPLKSAEQLASAQKTRRARNIADLKLLGMILGCLAAFLSVAMSISRR